MPPKTRRQTSWACGVWASWVRDRKTLPVVDPLEGNHELGEDINSMNIKALQFWLPIAKVSLKLKNRMTRSVRRILHLLLLEHPISL